MAELTLLPCPFCGGEPIPAESTAQTGAARFTVRCRSCACEGGWGKSATGAAKWWNMRTTALKQPRLPEWHPIATAPKSRGGFIDLWLSSKDGVEQWRETSCWWNADRELWCNHRGMWDCATHWMSAPAPPEAKG